MNLRAVSGLVGRLLLLLAAAQLIPLLFALWHGEGRPATAFGASLLVCAAAGAAAHWRGRPHEKIYRREATLVVVGAYVLASFFGALPYLLSGEIKDPVSALFESASGFTTTGASILTDIESLSPGILLWRSLTQWLGGMGILLLFVALFPSLGPGARLLYRLEVPGPTQEMFQPQVRKTATALWRIYVGLTVALVLLLLAGGYNPEDNPYENLTHNLYDAVCYAFTTVSIGGFAPYNDSVAHFESAFIEWTIIVFMLIAGVNFSLIFAVRRPRDVCKLCKDVEFRAYASIAAVLAAMVTLDRWRSTDLPLLEALREAAFNSVSLMTTTGFTTEDYDSWSDTSRTLLLLAMFVGGCAGSTAGGIKVGRLVMTLKMALREVHLMFNPRRVLALWVGERTISDQVARSLGGFMTLFAFLWLGVAAILALAGNDMVTSLSSSLACLSNVGPAMGAAGPSLDFSFFAGWEKLLLIFLMWLGRLEIVAVAAIFLPAFWRR